MSNQKNRDGHLWNWDSHWPAPAKLNLFLHVVGRRADGYHLLQTLFRFVDHGDVLQFSPRADSEIVLSSPLPGVPPDTDLTVRAARLLQAEAGCSQGVTITLEKRLPMGGGLGGGSSDAATVLLALNHLWGLGLPRERLQALGLTLGADVPIFIFGRNAFAEGVGETFTPVELPPVWYVVLEPPVQVPTADIFRTPHLRRDSPAIAAHDWQPGFGGNDLEAVAAELYPDVAEYIGWLSAFAHVRMTGSGACVFAEFERRDEAEAVLAQLPHGMRGWAARGLPSHPLAELGAP
ncbi:MAG: 4-diphosphocytidyl-2-C-methyl-D-erythritol kinase [Pseudomonadota bacterium]|nr:4-diphosphocytidyl-2-C-methyl-D-erythritol kinase [Pseudomonadota bacterium]